MRWNVSGLLKSTVGEWREYSEAEDIGSFGNEAVTTAPLAGKVRLMRTNRGILVNARLHTEIHLVCGRCLAEFAQPVNIDFSEEYLSTVDINTGAILTIGDPDAFTIGADQVLDLDEAIRQYGLLEIPTYPVCKDDCAGLCPLCGSDRNTIPCACQNETIDPRLSALQHLMKNGSGPIYTEFDA
jgi:uncharacterized protein